MFALTPARTIGNVGTPPGIALGGLYLENNPQDICTQGCIYSGFRPSISAVKCLPLVPLPRWLDLISGSLQLSICGSGSLSVPPIKPGQAPIHPLLLFIAYFFLSFRILFVPSPRKD